MEYLRQNGVKFQSTPPARGATQQIFNRFIFLPISIHAPREGGDASLYRAVAVFSRISIHAPREGGDSATLCCIGQSCPISIHAPREGGDSG